MKTRTNTDALRPLHRHVRPDAAQIGFCGCECGFPVFVGVKNSKSKKHRCFHAWTECCCAALDNDPESMTANGCVKYSTHYSAAVNHAMRYFDMRPNDLAEARRNGALPLEKTSPPLPPATGSPSSESPTNTEK